MQPQLSIERLILTTRKPPNDNRFVLSTSLHIPFNVQIVYVRTIIDYTSPALFLRFCSLQFVLHLTWHLVSISLQLHSRLSLSSSNFLRSWFSQSSLCSLPLPYPTYIYVSLISLISLPFSLSLSLNLSVSRLYSLFLSASYRFSPPASSYS